MANYVPRLKEKYLKEIRTGLKEKFSYKNDMMIPKLQKIVLNMGVGEAVGDSKKIKSAHADLRIISGQQPLITKAKKSIAGFKVREEMPLAVICSPSHIKNIVPPTNVIIQDALKYQPGSDAKP